MPSLSTSLHVYAGDAVEVRGSTVDSERVTISIGAYGEVSSHIYLDRASAVRIAQSILAFYEIPGGVTYCTSE
jgi:hypothetical protein